MARASPDRPACSTWDRPPARQRKGPKDAVHRHNRLVAAQHGSRSTQPCSNGSNPPSSEPAADQDEHLLTGARLRQDDLQARAGVPAGDATGWVGGDPRPVRHAGPYAGCLRGGEVGEDLPQLAEVGSVWSSATKPTAPAAMVRAIVAAGAVMSGRCPPVPRSPVQREGSAQSSDDHQPPTSRHLAHGDPHCCGPIG